jgi:hypothetical protein
VDAVRDASDVASASMNVAVDDSDAEAALEGAHLSLLSPVVLLGLAGPARRSGHAGDSAAAETEVV